MVSVLGTACGPGIWGGVEPPITRHVGLHLFWSFSFGSRPAFLPCRPYSRACVSVAVFLSFVLRVAFREVSNLSQNQQQQGINQKLWWLPISLNRSQ